MKRFALPLIASTLFLGASLLPAQDTPEILPIRPILYDPAGELKIYLNLSDDQMRSLQSIQQTRREAERAVYRQMNEKQEQLNALLQSGSGNATQIGQLMLDIAALRKQVPVSGVVYREEALKVLNDAQKQKLRPLNSALELQNTAWQAVNFNLLEAPEVRIMPAAGSPINRLPARDVPGVEPGEVTILPFPYPIEN